MKLTATFIPPRPVTVEANPATMCIDLGTPVARDLVERDPYTGDYTVTPSGEQQTLATDGKRMTDDLTIGAIPDDFIGSAVPRKGSADLTASGATVSAPSGYYEDGAEKSVNSAVWNRSTRIPKNPSIAVDSNGLITASYSETISIKPIGTSGYADASHTYPVTTEGSNTKQLVTEAGKTVTPTESQQTAVESGKFTTGNIVVDAIPADYVGSAVERRTSEDLLVTGSTVNVPAGYYAENEGKAIPDATHASPSSLTVNPSLEVDYDTGTITATNSASADVSPIDDDGYATLAFTHRVNVSGNAATQLYTLGANTYTPSGSVQTISAGQLLTGDQTIAAIAPPWYDMSGDMAWLGKGAELVGENFYKKVDTLDNTLYNGWTPSTTAKAIVASVTLSDGKFTATDIDQYAYYIFWECGVDIAHTGSPTLKALPTMGRALIVQNLVKRPSTWANIQAANCDATINQAAYTASFMRYYGTTTGSLTYTWASSNGLYFTATAPTISSTTEVSPTITPKTPVFNAKVNTSYMTTASANAIDQANTKWWIKGTKIYRVKRECFFDGIYRYMCGVVNSTAPSS